MNFILNNWTSILSVISFILSCLALYFNWQNTDINKKKFKHEQDDKKKADIVWQEVDGSSALQGVKSIKISNTGKSDAKNFRIFINDKEIETLQEKDKIPGDVYPTQYSFDGLKIVDMKNNFVPSEINSGLSATFKVRTNPLSDRFVSVKFTWDDEFKEGREKTFKYTPGNTKIAN
ncbi:hypothetical protein [Bacillus cereus]|uniref:hypothetical protein n=1 Tax=Bacillus cereus TaxID=1396 RepID=UPI002FDC70DE